MQVIVTRLAMSSKRMRMPWHLHEYVDFFGIFIALHSIDHELGIWVHIALLMPSSFEPWKANLIRHKTQATAIGPSHHSPDGSAAHARWMCSLEQFKVHAQGFPSFQPAREHDKALIFWRRQSSDREKIGVWQSGTDKHACRVLP